MPSQNFTFAMEKLTRKLNSVNSPSTALWLSVPRGLRKQQLVPILVDGRGGIVEPGEAGRPGTNVDLFRQRGRQADRE